jgi:hypothetical protein
MIKEIYQKIKKKYVKPKIERISIYHPEKGYLGMSKQMHSLHRERIKHEECIRRCGDK